MVSGASSIALPEKYIFFIDAYNLEARKDRQYLINLALILANRAE